MTAQWLVVCWLAIWPFSSGGKVYHMTAASAVPAASGTVEVQKDKANGDLKLDIKVHNLAHPSALTPSEDANIVWIRPNGGEAIKQGAIGVDNSLNGALQVETASKDFDLFITAEPGESVAAPSGVEVLKTHVAP